MVAVRKDLVVAMLLIATLVLAAPVLAARPHTAPVSFNLTTVPGPAPSSTGPHTMDAATHTIFDSVMANDTSALVPESMAFDSIGPGDSLQDAIDAAAPGSTIYLDPGIYYEHNLVVNKPINIAANETLGGTRANTIIDAQGVDRIFTVESDQALFLENLTLRNGHVTGDGGAISTIGGHILLYNSRIINCSATGSGGAIFSIYGVAYVINSAFSRCFATGIGSEGSGGAIFSWDGNVISSFSTFSDCSAPGSWGGAIEADSSGLYVLFSTFTRCSAKDGGALDFFDEDAYIYSSTFTDCTATRNGGAIWYLDGGYLELAFSSFSGCTAADEGGAIASAGDIFLSSTTFTGCSAGIAGGAIVTYFYTVDITNSTFTGCSSSFGGAIASIAVFRVTSSSFTGCSAADEGGAIISLGPSVIHFSRFFQNTAPSGPAVYLGASNNAVNNWWGSNADPKASVNWAVNYDPWLVLGITANPMSLTLPQTSYIRTNLTYDSDGMNTAGGGIFVPDAIPNTYAVVSGPGTVAPASVGSVNGAAQGTYVTTTAGTPTIGGTVDGQTLYVTLNVAQGTWTPAPTEVPNDDDWPQVSSGASGGSGGESAATTGSTGFPLMTVSVNIGGDSKAWQAIVTGTKLSDLIVTGTVQRNAGDNVTAPPGMIFQYISLVPARYDTITNAVINFTVPQAWLDENHIAPGGIVLYRLTANGWEALPTTVLYAKDGTGYFSAQSAGFSIFAIAGMPTPATLIDTVTTSQEIPPEAVQTPAVAAVVKAPVTTRTNAPPVPAEAPAGSTPLPVVPALIGLCCIGVIGGGWYARRWRVRRQNPALFEEYD